MGRRLIGVDVLGGRYASSPVLGLEELLQELSGGVDVTAVECKGKLIWWSLRSCGGPRTQFWHVTCTYGMTGMWTLEGTRHSCLRLRFGDGSRCHFTDPRHFGTVTVLDDAGLDARRSRLGPDMLGDPPTREVFRTALRAYPTPRRPDRTVCEALMDQSVICGVGNYIKAEALYRAVISPHRTVASLDDGDLDSLCDAIVDILRDSHRMGGTTLRDYRTPEGIPGSYSGELHVYGREADPAGSPVLREETPDGRTTWWVPEVQR